VEALVILLQNRFDQSFCWLLCLCGCTRRLALPRFSRLFGERGRRSRSSTYSQAFGGIDLGVAEALMLPFLVVEARPAADPGRCFGNASIGVQRHLLILQAAPQPLLGGVRGTIRQDRCARVPGTPSGGLIHYPEGLTARRGRSSKLELISMLRPSSTTARCGQLCDPFMEAHLCGRVVDFHAAGSRSTAPSRVVTSSSRLGIVSL
jgi:hypothetical protein